MSDIQTEIETRLKSAEPDVEVVLAEQVAAERVRVVLDHPEGVDLELCERVTRVLSDYLREYGIDVSSPGPQRPLRKPEHFERALGRRVKLKTQGRKLRGEIARAGSESVTVVADDGEVEIPYGEIIRSNLIEETA